MSSHQTYRARAASQHSFQSSGNTVSSLVHQLFWPGSMVSPPFVCLLRLLQEKLGKKRHFPCLTSLTSIPVVLNLIIASRPRLQHDTKIAYCKSNTFMYYIDLNSAKNKKKKYPIKAIMQSLCHYVMHFILEVNRYIAKAIISAEIQSIRYNRDIVPDFSYKTAFFLCVSFTNRSIQN